MWRKAFAGRREGAEQSRLLPQSSWPCLLFRNSHVKQWSRVAGMSVVKSYGCGVGGTRVVKSLEKGIYTVRAKHLPRLRCSCGKRPPYLRKFSACRSRRKQPFCTTLDDRRLSGEAAADQMVLYPVRLCEEWSVDRHKTLPIRLVLRIISESIVFDRSIDRVRHRMLFHVQLFAGVSLACFPHGCVCMSAVSTWYV